MTVAEKKVVRGRLSALQLAEALGNISEACRRRGMSRTQFYEYKRRFQTHGLEGLRDLPPVHKSHPMTTPLETVEKILALSAENPMWGCTRLSQQLKLGGGLGIEPRHSEDPHQAGAGLALRAALEARGARIEGEGEAHSRPSGGD